MPKLWNLRSCKNGTWKKDGYPRMSYAVSKIALNAITPIQQRSFDVDKKRQGIIVSGVCPGYCKTDMTSHKGFTTAEQGMQAKYIKV
jgi:NAD(P)-dependent dehydrogenase (short-subunit alcohol dehydrogenase family)